MAQHNGNADAGLRGKHNDNVVNESNVTRAQWWHNGADRAIHSGGPSLLVQSSASLSVQSLPASSVALNQQSLLPENGGENSNDRILAPPPAVHPYYGREHVPGNGLAPPPYPWGRRNVHDRLGPIPPINNQPNVYAAFVGGNGNGQDPFPFMPLDMSNGPSHFVPTAGGYVPGPPVSSVPPVPSMAAPLPPFVPLGYDPSLDRNLRMLDVMQGMQDQMQQMQREMLVMRHGNATVPASVSPAPPIVPGPPPAPPGPIRPQVQYAAPVGAPQFARFVPAPPSGYAPRLSAAPPLPPMPPAGFPGHSILGAPPMGGPAAPFAAPGGPFPLTGGAFDYPRLQAPAPVGLRPDTFSPVQPSKPLLIEDFLTVNIVKALQNGAPQKLVMDGVTGAISALPDMSGGVVTRKMRCPDLPAWLKASDRIIHCLVTNGCDSGLGICPVQGLVHDSALGFEMRRPWLAVGYLLGI